METQTSYVKALQIMYKALLAGPVLFAGIVILLYMKGGLVASMDKTAGNIFLFVLAALAVLSSVMSSKTFTQKLQEAKTQNNIDDKLNGYRAAFIIQIALIEGPSLFAIICYFLTGNYICLIILLLLVLNFLRFYPTKPKIVQQLELDDKEEIMFD